MSDVLTERILYFSTLLLNPENFMRETGIVGDWKVFYSNPKELAVFLKSKITHNYEDSVRFTKKLQVFNGSFDSWLVSLVEQLDSELHEYKYKNVNCQHFFCTTRLLRANSRTFFDYKFSTALGKGNFYRSYLDCRVSKEDAYTIMATFKEVMFCLAETLFIVKRDTEGLAKLGLPTETEELKALLSKPLEELGQLFSWQDTKQGYYWWAERFLDQKESKFFNALLKFFQEFDPNLEYKKKPEEIFWQPAAAKEMLVFNKYVIGDHAPVEEPRF
jgi:hypothetical protein